ncbi:MAG: ChaN family lipoprotein [Elusimicrobiota bacterium]
MLKKWIQGLSLLALSSAASAAGLTLPPLAAGLGAVSKTVPAAAGVPARAPFAVIVDSRSAAVFDENRLYDILAQFDVVYAGEKHDEALHHEIQAAVLKGLHARRPDLIVGLEMLDITQQETLDRYLDGSLAEGEFAAFWKQAWGFDFALYRPILHYAKSRGVAVRALNAPRAVISQVARGGLDSLGPEQRAQIPPVIRPIRDPRYLEYVRKAFEGHGPLPPERLRRMLQAQAVWNETMAANALRAAAGGAPVLVIAGSGHMVFGAGIAESLRTRSTVSQRVVLPYPQDGEQRALRELLRELRRPDSAERGQADFFWLLPAP